MCMALGRALARRGHEIEVYTEAMDRIGEVVEEPGLRLARLPCGKRSARRGGLLTHLRFSRRAAREIETRHREKAFDIIHAHFILPAGLAAMRAAKRVGCPYIITAHGSDVPGYNPFKYDRTVRMMGPLWRRVVRRAARLVCPSQYLLDLARAFLGDDSCGVVIPNGINAGEFRSEGPGGHNVLWVGRLVEVKGVDVLVRAARHLPQGWHVDIVGDGPEREKLRVMAEDCGADVRFHGWLDRNDPRLAQMFNNAGIFAFPAFGENFPMVLLEAMAAGRAIVAADGGGAREVVGDAALLVPPHDVEALGRALRELALSEEERRRLGNAGQLCAREDLSISRIAERHDHLFEDVLRERQRP